MRQQLTTCRGSRSKYSRFACSIDARYSSAEASAWFSDLLHGGTERLSASRFHIAAARRHNAVAELLFPTLTCRGSATPMSEYRFQASPSALASQVRSPTCPAKSRLAGSQDLSPKNWISSKLRIRPRCCPLREGGSANKSRVTRSSRSPRPCARPRRAPWWPSSAASSV